MKPHQSIEAYLNFIKNSLINPQIGLAFIFISLLFFWFYTFNLDIIPIFADEAIYIRWAQLIKNVPTLKFVPLQDGKQPLFMWILALLLKLKQDPLLTGRFLSVMSGWATVFVLTLLFTYLNPKLIKNHLNLLLTLIILSTLPFTFFFSRLALVDMMLTFFYALSIYLFLLYWQYPRLDLSLITGFSIGLAWLTKSPGLFLLIISCFWLVVKFILTKNSKIILHFIALTTTVNFVYGILRLSPNFHMITTRNKDYLFPLSKFLSTPWDPLIPHLKDTVSFYWFYFTPLGITLILLGLFLIFKSKPSKQLIIFSSFLFIPFIFTLIFAKVFTARYLLYFSLPLTFFLISFILQTQTFIKYTLTTILIIWGLFYNFTLARKPTNSFLPTAEYKGYLTDWTAGWGIKPTAYFFAQQAKSQKIVIGTEGYFGTMPDGLWIYLDQTPNLTIIGSPVPVKEIPQSLTESAQAGNLTYLVAHKSRFLIKKDDLNQLKLIKTYPKPPDPVTGYSDALLIWQVKP